MSRPAGAKPVPDSEIQAGILAEVARRASLGLEPPSITDLRGVVRGARERVCREFKAMAAAGVVVRPSRKRVMHRVQGEASGPVRVRVRPEESEWDQLIREHRARERRIRAFVMPEPAEAPNVA